MRYYVTVFLSIFIFGLPWFAFNYPEQFNNSISFLNNTGSELAAVIIAHNPKTVAELKSRYDGTSAIKQVRILIVPGHEPGYGGAEYGNLKEREMTVVLGNYLSHLLRSTGKYNVFITRSDDSWDPTFDIYFKNNWDSITAWEKAYSENMSELIAIGSTTKSGSKVLHNNAPVGVATRLYGITKWANENDIDITIHIHFNDNPGTRDHTGFAIYVPEDQYYNSTTTKAVVSTIFKRLAKYNPVSDLQGESTGIVKEPNLIAIGVNNTANAASMLIEYGYIYEKQFQNPDTENLAIRDLAYQTYLGLQDFFDPTSANKLALSYDTIVLPYHWANPISEKVSTSSDVFALQTALISAGMYPPENQSKNDCPRTGAVGPCTKSSIDLFQNRYGIGGEKDKVGQKTLKVLNQRFGVQTIN